MNFSQDQIIWIQEWLNKIEQDEEFFFEFRRLLFRMKQELANAPPPSPSRDLGTTSSVLSGKENATTIKEADTVVLTPT